MKEDKYNAKADHKIHCQKKKKKRRADHKIH